MDYIDLIYLSLQGELVDDVSVPWVKDAFTTGSECYKNYKRLRDAYERICLRLGLAEDAEEKDLIEMVDAMESIQEILCRKMFEYGETYALIRNT